MNIIIILCCGLQEMFLNNCGL